MGLLVLGCRKIYGHSHSSWPGSLGGLGDPSSVPGCARSTFPGGEGDLPAGKATSRRGLLDFGSTEFLLPLPIDCVFTNALACSIL